MCLCVCVCACHHYHTGLLFATCIAGVCVVHKNMPYESKYSTMEAYAQVHKSVQAMPCICTMCELNN